MGPRVARGAGDSFDGLDVRGLHDLPELVGLGVQEGPSAATQNRQASFNYFVALIGPGNQILAREEFRADFQFQGNRTRLGGVEELTQRAGFTADQAGSYQVAIGLALSREEVEYNRRLQR